MGTRVPSEPEVPDFDSHGLMVPPWVRYPNTPMTAIGMVSIGWRMGDGEHYWDRFREWWEHQQEQTRQHVCEEYPEPKGWVGFYNGL